MKTSLAYTVLLIILTVGFSSDVIAQSRGTVRYTIVVTEDMVGGRGSDFQYVKDSRLSEEKTDIPSASVSISFLNGNQELCLTSLEKLDKELDGAYSQDVFDLIQSKRYNDNNYPAADSPESTFLNDTGDYWVIMEFN